MEIPELNLISNFEAGVNCLQNPSLFSRFLSFDGVGMFAEGYSLWKCGVLILALLASFRCIIVRVKILILAISSKVKQFAASQPPIQLFGDDDFDSDSDHDSDDASSSDDDEDINSFYVSPPSRRDRVSSEEDFSVADSSRYNGDSKLRRRCNVWDRFSLSDLAASKGVVRFWDSVGLGLDFEDDSTDNVVSLWDLNKIGSNNSGGRRVPIPAVSMASPDVILSASSSDAGNVKFGAYDRRMGLRTPSILAEWTPSPSSSPRRSKVVGIDKKVYVIDDADSALTVGDMRNVKTSLKNLTESDGETWWRC